MYFYDYIDGKSSAMVSHAQYFLDFCLPAINCSSLTPNGSFPLGQPVVTKGTKSFQYETKVLETGAAEKRGYQALWCLVEYLYGQPNAVSEPPIPPSPSQHYCK